MRSLTRIPSAVKIKAHHRVGVRLLTMKPEFNSTQCPSDLYHNHVNVYSTWLAVGVGVVRGWTHATRW
mgnify:CR=1 FL=1